MGMRTGLTTAAAVGLLMALPATAVAGGARSWVAANGVDSGTCERNAPCRSFNYAMTQTTSGGEVVALDSSGYGPANITKSIELTSAPGEHATISPAGTPEPALA